MAQDSGFKSGVATTVYVVVGTVVGGLILAGLAAAYFSNLLPLVFLGIALFAVFGGPIIYFRLARPNRRRPLRRPIVTTPKFQRALQLRTGNDARPKERLKHLATVSLDTEVTPFDFYSEPLNEGDEIEVEAVSESGATFHFLVCDDYMLAVNEHRTVNFEYHEGKLFTTQFKKRVQIPESGKWHFIAYTPEGEEYTTVGLTLSKVE